MFNYVPSNHFWIVGGNATRVWSSAAAAYIQATDPVYVAWLAAGGMPTSILNEQELGDVLTAQCPAGWPLAAAKTQAQAALDKSDVTILRCYESGVAVPAPWAAYRVALRAIVSAQTVADLHPLPAMPDYPAGT